MLKTSSYLTWWKCHRPEIWTRAVDAINLHIPYINDMQFHARTLDKTHTHTCMYIYVMADSFIREGSEKCVCFSISGVRPLSSCQTKSINYYSPWWCYRNDQCICRSEAIIIIIIINVLSFASFLRLYLFKLLFAFSFVISDRWSPVEFSNAFNCDAMIYSFITSSRFQSSPISGQRLRHSTECKSNI